MRLKRFMTPVTLLISTLSIFFVIRTTRLVSFLYTNEILHHLILLSITATLFFVCLFTYITYLTNKDLRWYILSLGLYIQGIYGFFHMISLPTLGWSHPLSFDASEKIGFFFLAFFLWGLVIPFSKQVSDRIFQWRTWIFLTTTLVSFSFFLYLFFISSDVLLQTLTNPSTNLLLTSIKLVSFLSLSIVLFVQKKTTFFSSQLPSIFVLFIIVSLASFYSNQWDLIWWYQHLLWLLCPILFLFFLHSEHRTQSTLRFFSVLSIRARLFLIIGLTLIGTVAGGLVNFQLSKNLLESHASEDLAVSVASHQIEIANLTHNFFSLNLLTGSFSLLLIIICIYLFSVGIVQPLQNFSQAIVSVKQGNLSTRVTYHSHDEFGQLGQVFNQMMEQMEKNNELLQEKIQAETLARKATNKALMTLNEAKAKDEAILSSIGDGVVACDKQGRVVLLNHSAESLTEFSSADAIGKHYQDILTFLDESNHQQRNDFIAEVMKKGEKIELKQHAFLQSRSGRTVQIANIASPIKDTKGRLLGSVIVLRDVTRERTIDKAKTEFVSLASHQLRTPLSAIGWYTEMLLAGDAGKLTKKQEQFVKEVANGNSRMVELVNALLNVSRLELGTFVVQPEPIHLQKIAEMVISELSPKIKTKHLSFTFSSDQLPVIQADPKLTHMILENILSNAIKYTPDKGTIEMDLSLVGPKKKPTQIKMRVSDTGCGIPTSQNDKIFTKFFRADNVRQMDSEGTGLGLYIVKAIVDHSGGRVWFETNKQKGSTFFVTLPIKGMKKKEGKRLLT